MRKQFLIFALACGGAIAQIAPPAQPTVTVVPTVSPPVGGASRAGRHELFAREREQRIQEKAEDLADAEKKRKAGERALRRVER